MGEIRDYFCSCGYQKKIFAGAGMNGCNLDSIKHFFREQAEQFVKEKQEGRVQSYLLSNAIVKCSHCNNLETVPCFSYQTSDGRITYIKEECPTCGNRVKRLDEDKDVACPKCGLPMDYKWSGDWD